MEVKIEPNDQDNPGILGQINGNVRRLKLHVLTGEKNFVESVLRQFVA